ncbi:hypothetical protein Nepgr_022996 [Nepenthes gracilis]|uniref:Uncharacterized protein n=1 Tax=Nepenthes gracilis TaxID=150966 RepID=A0AAD3T249_NEPGR|nr:hypothetical protein Nepgr_022996 [Nepenthes gracilis]
MPPIDEFGNSGQFPRSAAEEVLPQPESLPTPITVLNAEPLFGPEFETPALPSTESLALTNPNSPLPGPVPQAIMDLGDTRWAGATAGMAAGSFLWEPGVDVFGDGVDYVAIQQMETGMQWIPLGWSGQFVAVYWVHFILLRWECPPVVGCADAHWFAVSLQLPCGWVDFLCSADVWLGMILMQKGAGLVCCFCMKWLMPFLMWKPYAGERWADAVRLAWRWKG